MSTAAFLPPPARPPHDPLVMRLSRRDGWRLAVPGDGIEADAGDGALVLAPEKDDAGGLGNAAGTLGGLVPPRHVALGLDGTLHLLDIAGGRVLRFDPCACRFAPLPCLVPPGSKLRAIAVGEDRLYIAAGNAVLVLHRQHLALLAKLAPPGGAAWEPAALAVDTRDRIWVADPATGTLHLFDRMGRHRRVAEGLGDVRALAIDCDGRVIAGSGGVARVIAVDGTVEERAERPEALAGRLPSLPFALDARGHLALGLLCRAWGASITGDGLFDARGEPVPGALVPCRRGRAARGRVLTKPLDSRIQGCVWHRLLVTVELPRGTRLSLRARTAELDLPQEMVADPEDAAWTPCGPFVDNVKEALILAPPGRFLWLEITLEGPGEVTPRLWEIALEFPRISLRRFLPGVWGEEPVSAEFTDRFLAVFDSGFRSIEDQVDRIAELFDPRTAPASSPRRGRPDVLAWLASWVGLDGALAGLPEAERRRLLRAAPALATLRGTPEGLRRMLLLHLGLDAPATCRPATPCPGGPACGLPEPCPWQPPMLVLEHWRLRRWLVLGHGRLGEGSRLWGERILGRSRLGDNAQADVTRLATERDPLRDPFHLHAHRFSVFLPAARARRPADRRRLERLIAAEAPAHTQASIQWVEPRMRLGIQATLGFDSALGTWPGRPLTLDQDRLGQATRIGGARPRAGFTLGRDARAGQATRLG
ncbi:phage tail protein [Paracraurococcus lichenis]|uniref:Phage tail protein n=1 Tax=Paracraurococcus lichenis TaxID=3064888 RepID=A0ABT9E9L8_9PROT|nr:phage tail protein [Paracraurococcus sp. LOR1-02]MDO9712896.1 phage tail protein [Paracraurococcus sp. LOR1-02]